MLIGPRGAGKTSVIELIRFALGAPALTDQVAQQSKAHALSILGSGSVTITMNDGAEDYILKRSAENWTTSGPKKLTPPLILSQNEIESVGLHAVGRLRLIDGIRAAGKPIDIEKETGLLSYIRSQTEQRKAISLALQTVRQQIRDLNEQLKDAEALKKQHADAISGIQNAQAQNQRLTVLSAWLANLSVRNGLYNRIEASLQQKLIRIRSLSTASALEPWPEAAGGEDPLIKVRQLILDSDSALETAVCRIEEAVTHVRSLAKHNSEQTLQFEEESRTLRRQLEVLQHGAGETARRLAVMQEKSGQLSALKELEKIQLNQLQLLQLERKKLLDDLESLREKRYNERASVISRLNKELAPKIHIAIERAGQNSEYASAIVGALRGSGLRFNEVAPLIADQLSPREFVELVEAENSEELARITGLTTPRASRIIDRIKEEGVEEILTSAIEDGITLSLLDGVEYKTTEHLSTGQRCTVVLPLLMKQENLPVIVDQPEDHLDNAFIVDTFIKAIAERKNRGQLVFSTHNANIPVLGSADQVIMMGSDGTRGFVRHSGPLDANDSILGITTIMEGGLKAFEQRSAFYHREDGLDLL